MSANDIIEIQQLLAAYVFAIDAKDYDALDDIFVPDAEVDYRATGGAAGSYGEIKPWLTKALAHFPFTQHLIGLPLIRLDSDTATARTMLFNPMQLSRPQGDHLFLLGCTYADELVRTTAGWRIAKRVETDFWVKDPPTDFTPEPAP